MQKYQILLDHQIFRGDDGAVYKDFQRQSLKQITKLLFTLDHTITHDKNVFNQII